MAYKKISDLTTASGYAAGDLIEMESAAGASVKSTFINAMLGNDGLDSSLEAGDAGKVSRFGIGVDAPSLGTSGFGQAIKGGFYSVVETSGWPVANAGNVICVTRSGGYDFFIGWAEDNAVYRGFRAAGTTGAITWNKIWDSQTDGNAGQPPAPKPRAATDSDIGNARSLVSAENTALVLPSGGKWHVSGRHYGRVSDGLVLYQTGSTQPDVYAGGSTIMSASSGLIGIADIWRTE